MIDARESIISTLAQGQQKITMKKGLFLLKLDFLEERYEKFVLFWKRYKKKSLTQRTKANSKNWDLVGLGPMPIHCLYVVTTYELGKDDTKDKLPKDNKSNVMIIGHWAPKQNLQTDSFEVSLFIAYAIASFSILRLFIGKINIINNEVCVCVCDHPVLVNGATTFNNMIK